MTDERTFDRFVIVPIPGELHTDPEVDTVHLARSMAERDAERNDYGPIPDDAELTTYTHEEALSDPEAGAYVEFITAHGWPAEQAVYLVWRWSSR